jgi:tetratricopeptide (TPR) repeat protein
VRVTQAVVAIGLCVWEACASHTPPPTATADSGRAVLARLDAADALVRAGCLDCLLDAFGAYESIRVASTTFGPMGFRAATGSVRAALLIELHERELGMSDDGYLQRARDLLMGYSDLDQTFQPLVAILDTIQRRSSRVGGASVDPAALGRFRLVQANRAAWLDLLHTRADGDELAASLWIAFSCANDPPAERSPAALAAALPRLHDAPGALYELGTCGPIDVNTLSDLLRREPRFKEVEFWLGMRELAQQHLDDAQADLTTAFDWHPRWPSAALALADISMTAENVAGALRLYDVTLSLSPDMPDASVGRVRALSYLGRYTDALAGVDDLERIHWFPGEAAYWRAWNEVELGRLEDSWTHVQQAELLWVNADVSKLAGIVAMKRGELATARGRFESARGLNPADCETLVYLGGVHADLRDWARSADVLVAAATCLQDDKADLARQIAALEASGGQPERVAHQTASRRQRLASADRVLAQSWFNTAADEFNLSRKAEARVYAERIVDDPQFGARARDLIAQLDK